jgi:hypothetical protein
VVGADNNTLFRQLDVGVPVGCSQRALDIVAAKYFHGANTLDNRQRERGIRQKDPKR